MTKQEAIVLDTVGLIKAFGLVQTSRFTNGKTIYEDRIAARHFPRGISKAAAAEILIPRKQEVLDYFKGQREAEEKARAERQAKIDAIPGLREIQNARADLAAWNAEFERSFDSRYGAGVGGMGVRPKPKYDIPAMLEQFPIAAAYLKAEAESMKSNYELAAIGKQALESIINDPEHYTDALAKMEQEHHEFAERHFWD